MPLFEHSCMPNDFVIYWQTTSFPLAANLSYSVIILIGPSQINEEWEMYKEWLLNPQMDQLKGIMYYVLLHSLHADSD